jgi:hypothetical protein
MSGSNDLNQRRDQLSSAKQALLEQRMRGRTADSRQAVISPKPEQAPARLSFAQERMFFASQLNPESTAYNMHAAYRLRGPLDMASLTYSLNQIVARHDVLRTRFVNNERFTEPVVVDALELEIPIVDLIGLPETQQLERLTELGKAEARYIFNLAELPLLRLTLARLSSQEHCLFLTLHHIICDEWSIKLLWNELEAGYAARLKGQSLSSSLPLQYVDFAHWQRERLSAGELDQQLSYWRERLAPPHHRLQFPFDHARPAVQRHRGAIAALNLSQQIAQGLMNGNQQAGTTPFMILLALYAVLLYRYSGQDDLFIGIPIANRSQPELERLMGVCLNTLVLRIDLKDDPSFQELLQSVRKAALEAYANSDVPFEKLVDELKPARHLSYHPLFQTMFVFQSEPSSLKLPGVSVEPFPVDGGVSKFDMTLFAGESDEGLEVFLEYNTDLIEESTARRFLTHFEVLAEAVAANPGMRISSLPVLSSPERRQLLVDWNTTSAELPKDNSIHELIEAWTRQTPRRRPYSMKTRS